MTGESQPAASEPQRLREWADSQLTSVLVAARSVAAALAVLWLLQVANWLTGDSLAVRFGVEPRQADSVPEILLAPLFHVSFEHLIANSVPLAVLGFIVAMRGTARFLTVTLMVTVLGDGALWAFGPGGTDTVGASVVIFGYFGYLLLNGFFERSLLGLMVGLCVGTYYGWFFLIAIPSRQVAEGVSWQGHLCGLFAGIVTAWVLTAWQRRFRPAPPLIPSLAVAPPSRAEQASGSVHRAGASVR